MAHTIYVRRVDRIGLEAQPLAYDIESVTTATRLARGIANSYATHGCDGARGTFWFVNREGLHELIVT